MQIKQKKKNLNNNDFVFLMIKTLPVFKLNTQNNLPYAKIKWQRGAINKTL